MTIKDRLDNLTDGQKVGLLMLTENIRKMDDFANDYLFKDEYFEESDPFYNIDCTFCMHSYTKRELLENWFNSEMLAEVKNINFALAVVEEAF